MNIHDRLRVLTVFQHWLGTEYNNLPTDSGNMTERAIRFSKEYPEIFAKIGGQAEVLVMPNERELTEYYNNEENQEWLNAPLGKQKASGAVAGQWQKEKPTKPCLFVHRYNEKDDKPGLQYAVMDCDVLCVTDIELNEFVSTMDEFADGEFFIIQFI